jgi:type III restriction enzyme
MKNLVYQQKAISRLVEYTCELLEADRSTRQKIIFEAPTGAGKTIVMASYLERLKRDVAQRHDLSCNRVAFIWLAPNQLHEQSYESLKHHFSESRAIRPVLFEEISNKSLQADEVLCINWQSVSREDNLYVKDNEQGKTLAEYVRNCRADGTEVIVVLDEAHLFASKGKKALELLAKLNAKIEIDVSATPFFKNADQTVKILRGDVVKEQMIKKSISLNPRLKDAEQGDRSSTGLLLDMALNKRTELENAYKAEGSAVRPLLLIQLPNDSATESENDKKIRFAVEDLLEKRGLTTKNEKLAVWLSNEKTNLENIRNNDGHQEVLIFKQAIALGWDCPRASVLLIFRELKQESFTIQTVGRILRMPEQRHYVQEDILNYGYVYTDLAKDMIKVVEDDLGYITMDKAIRITEYQPIDLPSVYIHRSMERNRLSNPDYKNSLFEAVETYWQFDKDLGAESIFERNRQKLKDNFIENDINKITIRIISDETLTGEREEILVSNKADIARTKTELESLLYKFCRQNIGGYAPVDSTPRMSFSMQQMLMSYCGYDEVSAMKIVLADKNQARFEDIVSKSLMIYEDKTNEKRTQSNQKIKEYPWNVPSERIYTEHYVEVKNETTSHALRPLFIQKDSSEPERLFMKYLDDNSESIKWWYKNGDGSQGDFAIPYQDTNDETKGFYVDFIIMHQDGTLGIFDTKTKGSDREAVNKHNALVDYLVGKKVIGGIIILDGQNWKYSASHIENDLDLSGWESYLPMKFVCR